MKKVFGVGYNDACYPVTKYDEEGKQIWMCPFYKAWRGILQRCYDEKFKERWPHYKDVTMCSDWIVFSKFKMWMETQNWENRALDKDFLVWGNKDYNPGTCAFLPQEVNNFLTLRDNTCENTVIGVTYYKNIGKWVAKVGFEGTRIYLGSFSTPEEAHLAYLKGKIEVANKYQNKYRDDSVVVKCLDTVKTMLETTLENKILLRRENV